MQNFVLLVSKEKKNKFQFKKKSLLIKVLIEDRTSLERTFYFFYNTILLKVENKRKVTVLLDVTKIIRIQTQLIDNLRKRKIDLFFLFTKWEFFLKIVPILLVLR